jgi:hypothetical protein
LFGAFCRNDPGELARCEQGADGSPHEGELRL